MRRLSVVIPVYNVEEYIGRCIESCISQDIPADDYEIIVINDGTPDNSMPIVESYQKRYPNIRIVNRPNGGLSAARNTGLSESIGRYVWFVDGDDWIEPNCLSRLLIRAEAENLDVLCFSAKIYSSPTQITDIAHATDDETVKDGAAFISSVNTIPSAWSALYRREYLRECELTFYEGILHEDLEFTPRAYSLAKRISYARENVYYYFQRLGGIMKSSRDEKRCRDLLAVADSLFSFANKNFDRNSEAYRVLIRKVNFAVTQSLAFYKKANFHIEEFRKRPYYPLATEGLRGIIKWKYRLINFSIPLYLLIYKYLRK